MPYRVNDAAPLAGAAEESGIPPASEANGRGHHVSMDELKREFERLAASAGPMLSTAKRYAETEAKLAMFKARENTRLAFLRAGAAIAGGAFLLAAWVMFSVFVYQLMRDVAPGLPWMAPLVVSAMHFVLGGFVLLMIRKLRLE